ncbi:hypothetical protein, partial [Maribacter litoralis]|uniref:hypothetical protein n=1 Tax=Maribacter litoralis TaxID=2059726 RepID=UPI003F5CE467
SPKPKFVLPIKTEIPEDMWNEKNKRDEKYLLLCSYPKHSKSRVRGLCYKWRHKYFDIIKSL